MSWGDKIFGKQPLVFTFLHSVINPSPDEEREVDLGTFVDEEEGHADDESDVELDGNDQLDLDPDA